MERRTASPWSPRGRASRPSWPGPPSTSLPSPPTSASRSPPTAAFAAFSASTTQGELTGEVTNGRKNVYVRDLRAAAAADHPRQPHDFGPGRQRRLDQSCHQPQRRRRGVREPRDRSGRQHHRQRLARPTSSPGRCRDRTAPVPVEWLTRDAVVPAGGNQSAALEDVSADGRYVAWRSAATNYVHLLRRLGHQQRRRRVRARPVRLAR